MNRRRGISLVETLAAMTVGSAVVGVTVVTLCMFLRTQSVAREHVHRSTTLSRLAEQFRADVRAAEKMDERKTNTWEFVPPNGPVVTYRAEAATLIREEAAAGKTLRREQFTLPEGRRPSIQTASNEISGDASTTIVRLTLSTPTDGDQQPASRIVRFEAPLGADHRFRGTPKRTAKHVGVRNRGLAPSSVRFAVMTRDPDGACPLFRTAPSGYREKGDRHRAAELPRGFIIERDSEPVPFSTRSNRLCSTIDSEKPNEE